MSRSVDPTLSDGRRGIDKPPPGVYARGRSEPGFAHRALSTPAWAGFRRLARSRPRRCCSTSCRHVAAWPLRANVDSPAPRRTVRSARPICRRARPQLAVRRLWISRRGGALATRGSRPIPARAGIGDSYRTRDCVCPQAAARCPHLTPQRNQRGAPALSDMARCRSSIPVLPTGRPAARDGKSRNKRIRTYDWR